MLAARSPQALKTPGAGGTSTRGMPSAAATATPCRGPLPPKATRVIPAGSWPRSAETARTARTMLATATW